MDVGVVCRGCRYRCIHADAGSKEDCLIFHESHTGSSGDSP